MKINIYSFVSALHDASQIQKQSDAFLNSLKEKSEITFKILKDPAETDENLTLFFIQSGGVENDFLNQYKQFPEPYLLLTYGSNNSLAASMEILSFLKQRNLRGEILHGSSDYIVKRLQVYSRLAEAKQQMKNQRLGIIGKPSDWLIASQVDPDYCFRRFQISLLDIPISELISCYQSEQLSFQPSEKKFFFDEKELKNAWKVYQALKKIQAKYQLQGLSIRCFDLLKAISTTGCLALSMLNDEQITATCEGDVASMLSMHILSLLTKQSVFQANPSKIDLAQNQIIFAHCTLPLSMCETYELMTHFESNIGVAIQGNLKKTDCTIFKLSNNLKDYFVEEGWIVENLHRQDLCRTQIIVTTNHPDYFLKNPYGNHHLIVYGHHKELIDQFFASIVE